MKKCYIYTRVSTAAQVEGYSLDAQKERIREYAAYKELEIAGEYSDAGKSGKNISGRPEFQRMLDDIINEKDGISYVIVFKLSRFGRNAADVTKTMQLLSDYGIDLVSVNDGIDSSTHGGKFVLTLLSAVAEMERENITIQLKSGLMQKLKKGGWLGGPVPYGYRTVDKELVVVPEEAEIIKLIYDKYLNDGMTLYSLVNYMNEKGYTKNVKGVDKPFTEHMVKAILDNPIYSGRFIHNRRKNKGQKDIIEEIEISGTHEIIIPLDKWERAHEKRKALYKSNKKIHDIDHESILSGLVKCPLCGASMYSEHSISKNKNHGGYYTPYYSYRCTNYRKQSGRRCSFSRQYNQKKVDDAVYEILTKLNMLPDFGEYLRKALGDDKSLEQLSQELLSLKKSYHHKVQQKDKIGYEMDNLDIMSDNYDEEYLKLMNLLDEKYDEIETIKGDIRIKEKQLEKTKKGVYSSEQINEYLKSIPQLYEKMTDAEKKEMYKGLIDRIELIPEKRNDGRLIKSITFRFPVFYDENETGNKADKVITYQVNCFEGPITSSEVRPTYAKLREYIFNKYGVKVSYLNIAQMKNKYGIDTAKNYNISKKENYKAPKCTAEKEKILFETFKHFKMIDESMEYIEGNDET